MKALEKQAGRTRLYLQKIKPYLDLEETLRVEGLDYLMGCRINEDSVTMVANYVTRMVIKYKVSLK